MGKNKWTRLVALCLAVACTLTVVFAAGLQFDINKDGKTTVWDLQNIWNDATQKDNYKDALKEALGGYGDELNPNENDEYEIYTELGLRNMARLSKKNQCAGMTFKLMNNIDMKGASWTPIMFGGTFDGQGYKIQNVNINKDYAAKTSSTTYLQGFFAKLTWGAEVKNLHLRNVVVTAQENTQYIGLLAGSSVGLVQDCTTTGTVVDERTNLTSNVYVGTLLGRVENATNPDTTLADRNVPGVVISDSNVLMTAEDEETLAAARETVDSNSTLSTTLKNVITSGGQKVLCKMALDYELLADSTQTRYTGIVGIEAKAPTNSDYKNYNWQEISGSVELQDPVLVARRQAVVDKMYEICTVEWTPSTTLTSQFYRNGSSIAEADGYVEITDQTITTNVSRTAQTKIGPETRTYQEGTTYRGMPYTHGGGSLERFESWLENGKTKTTLPTNSFYFSYMPLVNEINQAIAGGLLTQIENGSSAIFKYEVKDADGNGLDTQNIDVTGCFTGDQAMEGTISGADHSGFSRYLGNDCSQAIMWAWREVVSSDVTNGGTVISGVSQMAPTTAYQTQFGVLPVNGLIPVSYDLEDWETTYTTYGKAAYMQTYAQASRGDALIVNASAGGHSRMIAYDPIVIRGWSGYQNAGKNNFKTDLSYIITHEQGRGSSGDGWRSDCYVNCVYTFEQLTFDDSTLTNIGVRGHYMPMTLPAFHNVDIEAVTSTVTYDVATSVVKSNFYIVSTQLNSGEKVFTAVGQKQTSDSSTYVGSGYRDAHVQENMKATYGEENLSGTVTVNLSNGDVWTVELATGACTKQPTA